MYRSAAVRVTYNIAAFFWFTRDFRTIGFCRWLTISIKIATWVWHCKLVGFNGGYYSSTAYLLWAFSFNPMKIRA